MNEGIPGAAPCCSGCAALAALAGELIIALADAFIAAELPMIAGADDAIAERALRERAP